MLNEIYWIHFQPYVSQPIDIEKGAKLSVTVDLKSCATDYYYDAIKLPFKDLTFDTVISVTVIGYTLNPQYLFKEMTRLLKVLNNDYSCSLFFSLYEEPMPIIDFCTRHCRDIAI